MLVGKEIVNSRFKVIRKIDNGSFGEIYEGKIVFIGLELLTYFNSCREGNRECICSKDCKSNRVFQEQFSTIWN